MASELERFPKLLKKIAVQFSKRDLRTLIVDLDRLLRAKDQVGFALLDDVGISKLSRELLSIDDDEDVEQTAYMPPRIWKYHVSRLHDCLNDFLDHKDEVAACFHFCVDAYAKNYRSLGSALRPKGRSAEALRPFADRKNLRPGMRTGRDFLGRFEATAQRFGVAVLLTRWVLPPGRQLGISSLSAYLTLVQYAGLAYIATFTLQRIEEAASLRADCLLWEEDPVAGRLAVIRGETTKTDPDSDARWPTSPKVETAVDAVRAVAQMRMRCASANPNVGCSLGDEKNPLLFHRAFEPWCSPTTSHYSTLPRVRSYYEVTRQYPLLFEDEQMRMTEADLEMARMFTPNLDKGGKFTAGKVWPFAYHQLRRTSAVNMYASGLMSDSSIQVILKHRSIFQAAYYGRNHTRARFNDDAETLATDAKYEVMARQIQSLVTARYVSPAGLKGPHENGVHLIGAKDFKALIKAGKAGAICFRETRLGGCMKTGHCSYGGVESVARCAGGDGNAPCQDAVYDRTKRDSVKHELARVEELLTSVPPASPRSVALLNESRGLRNYLDATV